MMRDLRSKPDAGCAPSTADDAGNDRFDDDAQRKVGYSLPKKGSFADDDIDSDDAFNSDDDEKYGDFFKPSSGKPQKPSTTDRAMPAVGFDMSENASADAGAAADSGDEDYDDEDDDDEYEDLSSMLQTRAGQGQCARRTKRYAGAVVLAVVLY